MVAVVAFATVLLLAVLVSSLANRTVLSTAVVFLVGGFLLGEGVFGVIEVDAGTEEVSLLAKLALLTVLFTDGLRAGVGELRSACRLPGRALVFGLEGGFPHSDALFHLVALVVVGSILAHSSTDVLVARWFEPNDPESGAVVSGGRHG